MVCNCKCISKSIMERDILSLVVAPCLGSARCRPLIVESAIESDLCWEPFVTPRVETLRPIFPIAAEIVEPVWQEIVGFICQVRNIPAIVSSRSRSRPGFDASSPEAYWYQTGFPFGLI